MANTAQFILLPKIKSIETEEYIPQDICIEEYELQNIETEEYIPQKILVE